MILWSDPNEGQTVFVATTHLRLSTESFSIPLAALSATCNRVIEEENELLVDIKQGTSDLRRT